jgi:hypothetical protein
MNRDWRSVIIHIITSKGVISDAVEHDAMMETNARLLVAVILRCSQVRRMGKRPFCEGFEILS